MPFFDDISRKISKGSQSAIQKAKDMADIARINSAISEEEKNIDDIYKQIGKAYVEAHPNDCENGLKEAVNRLKNAQARLDSYRRQVQDLKGVARCPRCGGEVPANAAFCNLCGAPLPKPVQPQPTAADLVQCPSCGAMIPKGNRFCTSCGTPIAEAPAPATAPATAPVPEPPVSWAVPEQEPQVPWAAPVSEPPVQEEIPVPEPPVSWATPVPEPQAQEEVPFVEPEGGSEGRCPNCGASISQGAVFCTECGQRLS